MSTYECKKCNYTSNRKANYDRHLNSKKHIKNPAKNARTHNSKKPLKTCTNKRFFCKYCFSFFAKDNIIRAIKTNKTNTAVTADAPVTASSANCI